MNKTPWIRRLAMNEDLNFLLTNRVPRIALTRFMGWFSQIRQPWVRDLSMGVWRAFTDLDLSDAKKDRFESLHDCFTRELKPGARSVDMRPEVIASPSDAIVGACGVLSGTQVFQAKGYPYALHELLGDSPETHALPRLLAGGTYVTLRLTSAMYHRFHAPHDATLEHVTYLSGDTWNVNPIALQRVEKLFCRNERAVLRLRLADGTPLVLVPVAAILVASLRLHAADVLLHLKYRGPNEIPCGAAVRKGEELGWFQHGSTILVFVPPGFELAEGMAEGARVCMGQALLRRRRSIFSATE